MRGIVDLSGEVRLALAEAYWRDRLSPSCYLLPLAVASSLSVHKTHGVWDTQGI